jgi:SAM-dependent methyltransferase
VSGSISSYVERAVRKSRMPSQATILDLPCGFGRHSRWLAELGHFVVAVDIDPRRLAHATTLGHAVDVGGIGRLVANAETELPFQSETFDAVVTVHFAAANMVRRTKPVIRRGGYFIFESFGAQGENWRGLPAPGCMAKALADDFELLDYRERRVGPNGTEAAVVKFVARLK